jgi:hypothetical protein
VDFIDAKHFTYQKDNNLLNPISIDDDTSVVLRITQMNVLPLDPVLDFLQDKLGIFRVSHNSAT